MVLLRKSTGRCRHPSCHVNHRLQIFMPENSGIYLVPDGGTLEGQWECLQTFGDWLFSGCCSFLLLSFLHLWNSRESRYQGTCV